MKSLFDRWFIADESSVLWRARVTISTRTLINYQIFKFHIFSSHNQLQVGCFWYRTEGFLRILASKYWNFPKNNDYFRVCFRLFPPQWTPGVTKLMLVLGIYLGQVPEHWPKSRNSSPCCIIGLVKIFIWFGLTLAPLATTFFISWNFTGIDRFWQTESHWFKSLRGNKKRFPLWSGTEIELSAKSLKIY